MHVFPGPSPMVRSAGAGGARRSRLVVPALAHVTWKLRQVRGSRCSSLYLGEGVRKVCSEAVIAAFECCDTSVSSLGLEPAAQLAAPPHDACSNGCKGHEPALQGGA